MSDTVVENLILDLLELGKIVVPELIDDLNLRPG